MIKPTENRSWIFEVKCFRLLDLNFCDDMQINDLTMNFEHDEPGSPTGLFAVVSAYPVHNPHTAYTAVMSSATGVDAMGQRSPSEVCHW